MTMVTIGGGGGAGVQAQVAWREELTVVSGHTLYTLPFEEIRQLLDAERRQDNSAILCRCRDLRYGSCITHGDRRQTATV